MLSFQIKLCCLLDETSGGMEVKLEVAPEVMEQLQALPSRGLAELATANLVQAIRFTGIMQVAATSSRGLRIKPEELHNLVEATLTRSINVHSPAILSGVLKESDAHTRSASSETI